MLCVTSWWIWVFYGAICCNNSRSEAVFSVSLIQDHLPSPQGSTPLVRAWLAMALVEIVAIPPNWNGFDRLGLIFWLFEQMTSATTYFFQVVYAMFKIICGKKIENAQKRNSFQLKICQTSKYLDPNTWIAWFAYNEFRSQQKWSYFIFFSNEIKNIWKSQILVCGVGYSLFLEKP